jgi:hypothetical protein
LFGSDPKLRDDKISIELAEAKGVKQLPLSASKPLLSLT